VSTYRLTEFEVVLVEKTRLRRTLQIYQVEEVCMHPRPDSLESWDSDLHVGLEGRSRLRSALWCR
jgi:hypothetical protein